MEYLSRSIKVASENPIFKYHPKCEKIALTHLSFTDDIIFFTRGDFASVYLIFDTLQQFGLRSGLEISLAKSQIFAAGVDESAFQDMLQITKFASGSFPILYLGSPLVYGKLKTCHFNPLIDKITNVINARSAHTLTYAGRLELLKAVIQGIKSFWLHNFPIPVTIIDKISSICRRFFWGGTKPKVAWVDICLPKNEGGLGLKDCKNWNKVMLLKTLWDIHSNKSNL